MIKTVACHCGSADLMIRGFLSDRGYKDWSTIPITRGREESISATNSLPPCQEKQDLIQYIRNASKWSIVIGYDDQFVRWADLANGGDKSRIDAEFVVANFS